ncbi:hypothetical protein MWN34_12375 [Ancylobacter sp. 6x-1]|uniref:Uncharacterized protein n=1 Tax=Ancylobacter crimeensis TaxID=2579147 RepID=A0ABT0DCM6_9HYPH|nr:hypothetical protein [Ancylobacter crimeensis]MCK0197710.1 hypothetical protein [Ancylobacter crimeensis]
MDRNVLYAIIAFLVVVAGIAGVYAFREHEKDEKSLEIQIGPNGVKVDPPSK